MADNEGCHLGKEVNKGLYLSLNNTKLQNNWRHSAQAMTLEDLKAEFQQQNPHG